jgi:hypothetical protein
MPFHERLTLLDGAFAAATLPDGSSQVTATIPLGDDGEWDFRTSLGSA